MILYTSSHAEKLSVLAEFQNEIEYLKERLGAQTEKVAFLLRNSKDQTARDFAVTILEDKTGVEDDLDDLVTRTALAISCDDVAQERKA